jgi:hypothetical protein
MLHSTAHPALDAAPGASEISRSATASLSRSCAQFRADVRAGYQFCSKEVDTAPREGERRVRRFLRILRGYFWAMAIKLSPGRRILLVPNQRIRVRNVGSLETELGSKLECASRSSGGDLPKVHIGHIAGDSAQVDSVEGVERVHAE